MPEYAGFLFLFASALFFGSNLVPVKRYQTSDGIFFQFVQCVAIWCVGLIANGAQGLTMPMHVLPMLGGWLWCTANMFSVPVVRTLGLSLGPMLWAKICKIKTIYISVIQLIILI
jgi:hypothetical protein